MGTKLNSSGWDNVGDNVRAAMFCGDHRDAVWGVSGGISIEKQGATNTVLVFQPLPGMRLEFAATVMTCPVAISLPSRFAICVSNHCVVYTS